MKSIIRFFKRLFGKKEEAEYVQWNKFHSKSKDFDAYTKRK